MATKNRHIKAGKDLYYDILIETRLAPDGSSFVDRVLFIAEFAAATLEKVTGKRTKGRQYASECQQLIISLRKASELDISLNFAYKLGATFEKLKNELGPKGEIIREYLRNIKKRGNAQSDTSQKKENERLSRDINLVADLIALIRSGTSNRKELAEEISKKYGERSYSLTKTQTDSGQVEKLWLGLQANYIYNRFCPPALEAQQDPGPYFRFFQQRLLSLDDDDEDLSEDEERFSREQLLERLYANALAVFTTNHRKLTFPSIAQSQVRADYISVFNAAPAENNARRGSPGTVRYRK